MTTIDDIYAVPIGNVVEILWSNGSSSVGVRDFNCVYRKLEVYDIVEEVWKKVDGTKINSVSMETAIDVIDHGKYREGEA